MADAMKICELCNEEFLPNSRTKNRQRFCSKKCNRQWQYENGIHEFTCQRCGKVYVAKEKNRDKYCSRTCAFADIGAWRRKDAVEMASCLACGAEFRKLDGVFNYKYCSPACHVTAETKACVVCQQDFIPLTHGMTCSPECRAEYARRRAREIEIEKHRRKAKVCTCKVCGVKFCPLYGTKKRLFCSDKCAIKGRVSYGSSNIQRAKHFGVPYKYFSERKILERDGWRCYLCGCDTPKELRGTYEDNAPELDHVIPLSKCGPHLPDNVRCSCRACNINKADKVRMEQLAIVFA